MRRKRRRDKNNTHKAGTSITQYLLSGTLLPPVLQFGRVGAWHGLGLGLARLLRMEGKVLIGFRLLRMEDFSFFLLFFQREER